MRPYFKLVRNSIYKKQGIQFLTEVVPSVYGGGGGGAGKGSVIITKMRQKLRQTFIFQFLTLLELK